MWNDEFQLPDGSYSMSYYIKIILSISYKNMKYYPPIPLFIFTSIELLLDFFFKIKDEYKL